MKNTAGDPTLDFRLRGLQRFAGALGVTGGNRQLDLFDKGTDTAHACTVDGRATRFCGSAFWRRYDWPWLNPV